MNNSFPPQTNTWNYAYANTDPLDKLFQHQLFALPSLSPHPQNGQGQDIPLSRPSSHMSDDSDSSGAAAARNLDDEISFVDESYANPPDGSERSDSSDIPLIHRRQTSAFADSSTSASAHSHAHSLQSLQIQPHPAASPYSPLYDLPTQQDSNSTSASSSGAGTPSTQLTQLTQRMQSTHQHFSQPLAASAAGPQSHQMQMQSHVGLPTGVNLSQIAGMPGGGGEQHQYQPTATAQAQFTQQHRHQVSAAGISNPPYTLPVPATLPMPPGLAPPPQPSPPAPSSSPIMPSSSSAADPTTTGTSKIQIPSPSTWRPPGSSPTAGSSPGEVPGTEYPFHFSHKPPAFPSQVHKPSLQYPHMHPARHTTTITTVIDDSTGMGMGGSTTTTTITFDDPGGGQGQGQGQGSQGGGMGIGGMGGMGGMGGIGGMGSPGGMGGMGTPGGGGMSTPTGGIVSMTDPTSGSSPGHAKPDSLMHAPLHDWTAAYEAAKGASAAAAAAQHAAAVRQRQVQVQVAAQVQAQAQAQAQAQVQAHVAAHAQAAQAQQQQQMQMNLLVHMQQHVDSPGSFGVGGFGGFQPGQSNGQGGMADTSDQIYSPVTSNPASGPPARSAPQPSWTHAAHPPHHSGGPQPTIPFPSSAPTPSSVGSKAYTSAVSSPSVNVGLPSPGGSTPGQSFAPPPTPLAAHLFSRLASALPHAATHANLAPLVRELQMLAAGAQAAREDGEYLDQLLAYAGYYGGATPEQIAERVEVARRALEVQGVWSAMGEGMGQDGGQMHDQGQQQQPQHHQNSSTGLTQRPRPGRQLSSGGPVVSIRAAHQQSAQGFHPYPTSATRGGSVPRDMGSPGSQAQMTSRQAPGGGRWVGGASPQTHPAPPPPGTISPGEVYREVLDTPTAGPLSPLSLGSFGGPAPGLVTTLSSESLRYLRLFLDECRSVMSAPGGALLLVLPARQNQHVTKGLERLAARLKIWGDEGMLEPVLSQVGFHGDLATDAFLAWWDSMIGSLESQARVQDAVASTTSGSVTAMASVPPSASGAGSSATPFGASSTRGTPSHTHDQAYRAGSDSQDEDSPMVIKSESEGGSAPPQGLRGEVKQNGASSGSGSVSGTADQVQMQQAQMVQLQPIDLRTVVPREVQESLWGLVALVRKGAAKEEKDAKDDRERRSGKAAHRENDWRRAVQEGLGTAERELGLGAGWYIDVVNRSGLLTSTESAATLSNRVCSLVAQLLPVPYTLLRRTLMSLYLFLTELKANNAGLEAKKIDNMVSRLWCLVAEVAQVYVIV
ncbi:hypothetical protein M427DRAFT_365467 [Gonapodya prolifera JEL478]|uniref:Uncharacterized protein n=1 Tax=Gonapodya prolifera (strain JEL478) TaxID=1344416 RepID=A0A139AAZ1_GONPJ|nr:hypothetical protein M427DRAFT_365467 [Gonapodya prolifera JEL478]|eukprot:KXS13635.1 hypothetical protein M427DRAFT_365467 [Gonapodya prolifera JEL478]